MPAFEKFPEPNYATIASPFVGKSMNYWSLQPRPTMMN